MRNPVPPSAPATPRTVHGTIFVAGSLHAPWPAEFTARTRAHIRAPLVNPVATANAVNSAVD